MFDQAIIERITKLLNLADSKSYNSLEAAVALKKAIDLANKYSINISELTQENKTEEFVIKCSKEDYNLYSLFISKLSSYYRVVFLIRETIDNYEFVFIGLSLDLKIFTQSINYLIEYYKICFDRKFFNRSSLLYPFRKDESRTNGYLIGFIVGVLEVLGSMQTAIVLNKDNLIQEAKNRYEFDVKEQQIDLKDNLTASTVDIGIKDGKSYNLHGTLGV